MATLPISNKAFTKLEEYFSGISLLQEMRPTEDHSIKEYSPPPFPLSPPPHLLSPLLFFSKYREHEMQSAFFTTCLASNIPCLEKLNKLPLSKQLVKTYVNWFKDCLPSGPLQELGRRRARESCLEEAMLQPSPVPLPRSCQSAWRDITEV